MNEQPSEKLEIPALPPTSADFDSYVADVIDGDPITNSELNARFNASGGYARDGDGRIVRKSPSGTIFTSYETSAGLPENRSVSREQQKVIKRVAERIKTLSENERQLQDTASYLNDVITRELPVDELPFRFRAFNGYARDEGGRIVRRSPSGSIYTSYETSAGLPENRSVSKEQQKVIKSVAERIALLTKTETGLRDTGLYLEDVLSGEVPRNELPFRFRAFNGYARDEGGRIVRRSPSGSIYTSYETSAGLPENRSVSKEQQKVITYIAKAVELRSAKSETASADVVAKKIVTERLSAQAATTEAKLLGLDATAVNDFASLANLRGAISNPTTDNSVARLLETGADSDLLQSLNEQRGKYADISDTSIMQTDLITLESYIQTARRISLRSRFWQQANENIDGVFGLLESYAIIDDGDKSLVQDLRGEGLAIRRDNFIADAYRQIGNDNPDFTNASLRLAGAAKIIEDSRDEEGRKIIASLTDSAYQSEINLFFGNLISELALDRTKIAEIVEKLDTAPIRPAIAGVDFFEKFEKAKAELLDITTKLNEFAFQSELSELRRKFGDNPNVQDLVQEIIDLPGELPEDTELRQSLLDELALIITAKRGLDPGRFALLQEVQIDGIRASRAERQSAIDLTERSPERNMGAVGNLVRRYQTSIMPLFEVLRGGAGGKVLVDKYVSGVKGDRNSYVQRVSALKEQRKLTPIEETYLESVQLLTVFNPHLIALVREQPELTSLYLEKYFSSLDQFTKSEITDGMYVPALQIGLGPNGLASAGELNRVNPEIASQTLYVDANELPGGPFGVAKGQSWELNSANSISTTTNILPDILPTDEQGISVRSYGSPLASYPGERKDGSDIRQSSINVTVDYLPNPDNISTKRYPTNLDLARILQLQSAMLTDNVMLSTRITNVSPIDDGKPGNKEVTLQYKTPEGKEVTTTIRTDSIIVAGGLGEPNYGIKLEGSKAARIIEESKQTTDNFPRLTDTIGAFSVLSDPEGEPAAPKGSIAIYGGGNSADVLIEYLGRQFESGNPNLNGISKVYVVTTAELSKRPRYAQINDLKSRNGQGNFLELVREKVVDVAESSSGRLQLIGQDGQPLTAGRNGQTSILEADHVIAASGFRPMLDEVFKDFLADEESLDRREKLGKVRLPNNPGFSVADELLNDPSITIVGTGSRADFNNPNKLSQLPNQAREALLRNGAENAVAIGFRTPDTRAAIRIKYTGKTAAGESGIEKYSKEKLVDIDTPASTNSASVPLASASVLPVTRRDVDAGSDTLSAIFLESLSTLRLSSKKEGFGPGSEEATRVYTFQVDFDESTERFTIGSNKDVPAELQSEIATAIANPYVQSYALKALQDRRVNRGLEISLAFSRGKLQYRDPGSDSQKGRTYVEAL